MKVCFEQERLFLMIHAWHVVSN